METSRFNGNLLVWPVTRLARTYRIYVVEPETYCPEQHGKVFQGALNALVTPERSLVDPFSERPVPASVEHFDLITFPEAFLPQDDLLSTLTGISTLDSLGCVHVDQRV